MTKAQTLAVIAIVLGGAALTFVILGFDAAQTDGAHGHEEGAAAPAVEKGPHGGRMLRGDDGFALEVTIYEPDIPPQSRVYAYRNDKPMDPATVELRLELHRFDRVDVFSYKPQDGYLQGDKVVEEPHSFDVKVKATSGGKSYAWEYPSYEGRVEIPAASAASAGLVIEKAVPRKLALRLSVLGQVRLNEDTARHLSPRYPGVVRELRKQVGDSVHAGETVAIVEGNESLQAFEIRSPGAGSVVEKRVTSGETVDSGETLYVVADLSTVWVDFTVYREDAQRVRSNQRVEISVQDEGPALEGKLSYVAPIGNASTQSFTARAVVKNRDGKLRPGLFVRGEVLVDEVNAPVAVKESALQTFRDWDVVFKQRGTVYEIGIVELGVKDGEWVEVRSGIAPGQTYVAENSFVVKAEIGKSGATHDH
jgi:membrane fusion protein, heavy metal efflux system